MDKVLLLGEAYGYGANQHPILSKLNIQDTNTAIIFWGHDAVSFCKTLCEKTDAYPCG
jgi:hypothetical protein